MTNKNNSKLTARSFKAVVFNGKSVDGWTAPLVGAGKMRFVHAKHGEFKVSKNNSKEWMRDCWTDFLEFVRACKSKTVMPTAIYNKRLQFDD